MGLYTILIMKKNWFITKQLAPRIYGIGEFDHAEEVISYLIVGRKKALLFDTGLGIGDMYQEVRKITQLPIIVINSHHHFDHIGGNYQFKEHVVEIKKGEVALDPFRFQVIPTPGHSPDSICLYEKSYGYLFSGDTLYPGPIYLFLPDSNVVAYRVSIQVLCRLNPLTKIFPGHNEFSFDKKLLPVIKQVLQKAIKGNEIVIQGRTSLLFVKT